MHKLVNYDGKERKLKYDINALCDFEDVTGLAFGIILVQPDKLYSFKVVRALLWAGLKHEDNKLTVPEMGNIINNDLVNKGRDLADFANDILEAIEKSGLAKDLTGKTGEPEGNGEAGTAKA